MPPCDAPAVADADPLHRERLLMAGLMSAALMHELSQPITTIEARIEACRHEDRAGRLGRRHLQEVLSDVAAHAARAADVIGRMRGHLRSRPHERTEMCPGRIVRSAIALMQPLLRMNGVGVGLELEDTLPAVTVDPVQIEQALTNLIANGIEATVAAGVPEPFVTIRAEPAASHVSISIHDNGPGFADAAHIERVVSPFVTGRPRGLGLGLPVARHIIEAHGGELVLRASPRGGRVSVRLPLDGCGAHG